MASAAKSSEVGGPQQGAELQPPELDGGVQNRIIGLEYVEAGDLAVHPGNWRHHPEGQRAALRAAFDRVGVADAVLAYHSERNDGALTLIDGHMRRDMLNGLVPVLVLDVDDLEADILLASHDVITVMADRDELKLGELLRGIADEIPRDLMTAIDPDLEGSADEIVEVSDETADAVYPILPLYDEGYDSVIVFATTEADFAWLEKELGLPTMQDRRRIGLSHVITAEQFRERWFNRKPAAVPGQAEEPDAPAQEVEA